jgi:hypothetical protein
MANVLKMALIESILSLHAQRWSQRRIARELQIDRETVRKYLRERLPGSKPAIAPAGSDGSKPATFAGAPAPASKPASNLPTGSEAGSAGLAGSVEVAAAPLAPPGPLSHCEPYREIIVAKVQEELSAERIWQDMTVSGANVSGAFPSAGWNVVPARKRKWTSAPARRSSRPTASAARRTSFGSS